MKLSRKRVTFKKGNGIEGHDLGQALGCPSHMRFLLREQTGAFALDTAVTVEELKAGCAEKALLPMDAPLLHLPRFDVPIRLRKLCLNGVRLRQDEWPGGVPADSFVRLYIDGQLIGVSRAEADGSLIPRAVLR